MPEAECVRVFCRFRPFNKREIELGADQVRPHRSSGSDAPPRSRRALLDSSSDVAPIRPTPNRTLRERMGDREVHARENRSCRQHGTAQVASS